MSEIRRDPILDRTVIFAPERARRPSVWREARPERIETDCPFCPGNERLTPPEIAADRDAESARDAPGWSLRVIPNRYPALRAGPEPASALGGRHAAAPGFGAHEVIIESPVHDHDLCDLAPTQVERFFEVVQGRMAGHARDPRVRFVQVFKNHGPRAGASLAHGHAQLIATPYVPDVVAHEISASRARSAEEGGCPYCSLIARERSGGARLVAEGERIVVLAPFAARMPFETWLLPRDHGASFVAATRSDRASLAALLTDALRRIRRALGEPDYNLILHTAPCQEPDLPHYHWHVVILPRTASFGGFEWGTGSFINPTLPEEAAAALRRLGT